MSDRDPLISFVLPTKNAMPDLVNAIQGVLLQNYERYELVIQDGASTDDTLAYVGSLSTGALGCRVRVQSEPDSGIGQAYGRGLRRATGDLVWFLASDEVLYPGAVTRAVEWYRRCPSAASIYSGMDLIDGDGALLKSFMPPPFDLLRFMHCAIFPTTSGILNRRVIGEDLYYDESLKTCPDYDFWIRLGSRFTCDQLIAVPEKWTSALGTRTSMSYRVEIFDQFCYDKLHILRRFLRARTSEPITHALETACAAGIYCWAAECVYDLAGLCGPFLKYLQQAARLDPGSARVSQMARYSLGATIHPRTGKLRTSLRRQLRRPTAAPDRLRVEDLGLDGFETYPHWQGASLTRVPGAFKLRTADSVWAYSAFLPFRVNTSATGRWMWVRVRVRVVEGAIGVGILCNTPGGSDEIMDEQIVSVGSSDVYVKLDTSRQEVIAGLMIRNTSRTGPSQALIEQVSVVSVSKEDEEAALRALVSGNYDVMVQSTSGAV
jgi:glycosyl transferase family 2